MSEIQGREQQRREDHSQQRRVLLLHVQCMRDRKLEFGLFTRLSRSCSINRLSRPPCLPQNDAGTVGSSSSRRQRQTSIHRPAHVSVLRPHNTDNDFLVEVGEHALQCPGDQSLALCIAFSPLEKGIMGNRGRGTLTQQPTSTPSP